MRIFDRTISTCSSWGTARCGEMARLRASALPTTVLDEASSLLSRTSARSSTIPSHASKLQQARDAGIQRIHKDFVAVNQLFKDLSGIVIQQGDAIRSIDTSVEKSVDNSRRAHDELSKTNKRQNDTRLLAIRIAIFVIAFLLSIFLTRRIRYSHW